MLLAFDSEHAEFLTATRSIDMPDTMSYLDLRISQVTYTKHIYALWFQV